AAHLHVMFGHLHRHIARFQNIHAAEQHEGQIIAHADSACVTSACVTRAKFDYALRNTHAFTFLACSTAAPIKPMNSGCPSRGLDVNSGWNWQPTNQG